jgi:hypothetical protein
MNEHQRRIIELLRSKPVPVAKQPIFQGKPKPPSNWQKHLAIEAKVVAAPAHAPKIVSRESRLTMSGVTNEAKPAVSVPFHVDGFEFVLEQKRTVARCKCCWLGFIGYDWNVVRPKMINHRETFHAGAKQAAA